MRKEDRDLTDMKSVNGAGTEDENLRLGPEEEFAHAIPLQRMYFALGKGTISLIELGGKGYVLADQQFKKTILVQVRHKPREWDVGVRPEVIGR